MGRSRSCIYQQLFLTAGTAAPLEAVTNLERGKTNFWRTRIQSPQAQHANAALVKAYPFLLSHCIETILTKGSLLDAILGLLQIFWSLTEKTLPSRIC